MRRLGSALLLILALAFPARAAITAVGTTASGTTGATATNSLTFAHDSGSTGANRLLICGVSKQAVSDVTGITCNGVALSLLDNNEANANGVELWSLASPATGSHTVVVSTAASIAFVTGCQTFAGVNLASPFNTVAKTDGSSSATSAPLTVTSATGELVFSVLGRRDSADAVTTDGAQTQLWQSSTSSAANNIGVGSTKPGAAPTVDVTYTWSNGHIYAHSAVSLKPAPDAPASRPRLIVITD